MKPLLKMILGALLWAAMVLQPCLTFERQSKDGETYLGVHCDKVALVLVNAVNELHDDFESQLGRKDAEIRRLARRRAWLEQLVAQSAK